jgi:hypothetical protein|tara:strand:- start:483 stop:668 length:186 start_codon:yes stop_codon:yes gene_type:complete
MATISDLIGGIKASQGEIALSLARGNASAWEAYHRMVGQHEGLQQALDILDNLMKDEDEHE